MSSLPQSVSKWLSCFQINKYGTAGNIKSALSTACHCLPEEIENGVGVLESHMEKDERVRLGYISQFRFSRKKKQREADYLNDKRSTERKIRVCTSK